MPGRARQRPQPNPGKQELPEFAPNVLVITEMWLTEYIEIGSEAIKVVDYLIRDGVVTSERRERVLTEQEVNTLYRSGIKRTFDETCDHISSIAQ